MDFGACIFFLAVLAAETCNSEGTVCTTNSECGSGECCYIKPAFEIVRRRRQASILPVQPRLHHTGVCESYRLEHEHCGPLEQANGHCGCGAGMSCQFVPAEIATVNGCKWSTRKGVSTCPHLERISVKKRRKIKNWKVFKLEIKNSII